MHSDIFVEISSLESLPPHAKDFFPAMKWITPRETKTWNLTSIINVQFFYEIIYNAWNGDEKLHAQITKTNWYIMQDKIYQTKNTKRKFKSFFL